MSLKFNWGGYYEAVNSEEKLSIDELVKLDDVFQILADVENFKSLEQIDQYRLTLSEEKINKLNSPLLDAVFIFVKNKYNNSCLEKDIPEIIDFISTKREYNLNIICNNRKSHDRKALMYEDYDMLGVYAAEKNLWKILTLLLERFEIRIMCEDEADLNLLRISTENSSIECIEILLKYMEKNEVELTEGIIPEIDMDLSYIVRKAAQCVKTDNIAKMLVKSKFFDKNCFHALFYNRNTIKFVLKKFPEKISLEMYLNEMFYLRQRYHGLIKRKCMKVYGVNIDTEPE